MKDLKFHQIVKNNKELNIFFSDDKQKINVSLLSNISIHQLKPIIEYNFRFNKLNVDVTLKEYDNIIQESSTINKNDIVIVFWEIINIIESFPFEFINFDENRKKLFYEKITGELDLLFNNLEKNKLVFINKFNDTCFYNNIISYSDYYAFIEKLNNYLTENKPDNFVILDNNNVFKDIGVNNSIDLRSYYSSKTLYTISFYKEYVQHLNPYIFSISGKSKKAIIFDCDNTLWKGIVGEDGYSNVALSEKHKNGLYFKEIHLLIKNLISKGVIVGICSKNNFQDVADVFENRKDINIQLDDFTIKKINWHDKAKNLIEISNELNIGTDSIVFVDDSEFEIGLINSIIPEIQTVTVPKKLYEYPSHILKISSLFFNVNSSDEDARRNKMYLEEKKRKKVLETNTNLDDYINQLGIRVEFSNKDEECLERLAQLTQKTNQFNFTTKRYSLNDMKSFYDSNNFDVISISVSDNFGDSGVTGLCILNYESDSCEIDSFLMSCRVLGRHIEYVFLNELFKFLSTKNNCKFLSSSFIKSNKNTQVQTFYESNGFKITYESDEFKKYQIKINEYQAKIKPNIITSWKKK